MPEVYMAVYYPIMSTDELREVIGVFSSMELAEAAIAAYVPKEPPSSSGERRDHYHIEIYTIDAEIEVTSGK